MAEAGRRRRVRDRNLAELHGVQERPPHPARRAAARRRRFVGLSALSGRLQYRRQEHRARRRRARVLSAAADYSGEVARRSVIATPSAARRTQSRAANSALDCFVAALLAMTVWPPTPRCARNPPPRGWPRGSRTTA